MARRDFLRAFFWGLEGAAKSENLNFWIPEFLNPRPDYLQH